MLEVYICIGSSCHVNGSYHVINTFQELVKEYKLEDKVEIKPSFCLGHCSRGVSVKAGEEFIEYVTETNAKEKFEKHILSRFI